MAKHEAEEEEEEEYVMERFIGRSTIIPPKLKYAGLEDCALPPESIMEAFSRAALSLKSRIVFPFSGEESLDGACLHDPMPSSGQIPDMVHGAGEMSPPMGPVCGGSGKGAEFEGAKDDVIVFGAGEEGEGKRGCIVDGDVVPGMENGDRLDGDLEDDEESQDGPILVGGFA